MSDTAMMRIIRTTECMIARRDVDFLVPMVRRQFVMASKMNSRMGVVQ